jgi:hypothetical protein
VVPDDDVGHMPPMALQRQSKRDADVFSVGENDVGVADPRHRSDDVAERPGRCAPAGGGGNTREVDQLDPMPGLEAQVLGAGSQASSHVLANGAICARGDEHQGADV